MLKSEADKNLSLRQICAAMRWQRSRRLGVPRTVVYLNEDEPWRKLWSELMLRKRGMRLRQPKLAGRRGSVSRGRSTRYLRRLREQRFHHPAYQISPQEMVKQCRRKGVHRTAGARHRRVCSGLIASLAPVVRALQALRGVDLNVAVTFVTEIGNVRRFENPASVHGLSRPRSR
jgi:hypothetical protein